ncbi:heterokaryon incompatibility protein-domain-containing protein [Xylariaceae sp. FL1651]|nr:heterokaryon incompatibility protein-domain-containing protein [Xylariaceae sp. FL1651]
MQNGLLVSAIAVVTALFLKGADAARICGSSNASSTYLWRVSDARYDGADPSKSNSMAVVGISIVPNSTNTFFDCVAEWPEAWAGWSAEDNNIIWSDCIWSGAGPTFDTTVAFAVDWRNRTMYLSHTFSCSDKKGSNSMATGSFQLDMDCTTATDTSISCALKSNTTDSSQQVNTKSSLGQLATGATCEDNANAYQSWQLENWHRQYEITPGDPVSTPPMDTGPSFTLRNLANGGVFDCAPLGKTTKTDVFDGACKPATAGANTTATFQFDRVLDMVYITQQWECDSLAKVTKMAWSPFTSRLREFDYPRLCSQSRTFRVIKLLPPMRSSLPPFRETLNAQILEISLRELRISGSLELALLSLARQGNTSARRPIFADQICINQANNNKKIEQVRLMGDIYARSASTIVWLGKEARDIRRYFKFTSELCGEGVLSRVVGPNVAHFTTVFDAVMDPSLEVGTEDEREDRDDILDLLTHYGARFPVCGIAEVFHSAWVGRLWTVQEGCLSHNVIFRCGDQSLSFDCFRAGLLFHSIWNAHWMHNPHAPMSKHEPFKYMYQERKAIHSPQEQQRSLYDLVVKYNINDDGPKFGATNPEDRIYALLGLARNDDIAKEVVEGMEARNVRGAYIKFTAAVVKRNLDLIPSWMPDWSMEPLRTPSGYSDPTTAVFFADDHQANHDTGTIVDVSAGRLQVHGILVGRVIRVGIYIIQQNVVDAILDNIEYTSVRHFFDELNEFMEAAMKIDNHHAPDISDEQQRLQSTIRLSDGSLSIKQFATQFNLITAHTMLQTKAQSMSTFVGIFRSAEFMPWYCTPANEIDVVRLCAIDPITAARNWVVGALLIVDDVIDAFRYSTTLRLHKSFIRLRQRWAKSDFGHVENEAIMRQVGLSNDIIHTREWEAYISNLLKNKNRKLFLTDTGYVGLAVPVPQGSDISSASTLTWVYLGEAYCDGVMDEELVEREENKTQIFEIV